MISTAIHQLVAGFALGDAISHEALAIRDICRDAGLASEIYAPHDRIASDAANTCHPLSDYQPQTSDTVIFHYSITSPATTAFQSSPGRKIVIYHNITPPEFFVPFDASVARQLTEARQELKAILTQADAVWADSAFNAAELNEMLGGGWQIFVTMQEAFEAATLAAKSGEVIMLAPGCASTDQFRDFRDRGNVFKAMAKEWLNL